MTNIRGAHLRATLLATTAVLLSASSAASAQAIYGQILGSVTDATGAAIPNATVVVTDTAKGTSATLQSNAAGEFTADHLIPDLYTIKVSATGFKGFEQKDLQVYADTSPKVAAVLTVGASDQTVEVSADQLPQLKVDRADVSTVFGAQEIQDLPVGDRNFTNLQLLLPGAQQLGWSHAASENPQGSKQIQVDGQAFGGVAFELDGTDNQDPILGIIVINPNVDSLSETKITTQNFDAEFGKAVSSVVTAQTKSGSNTFHGSLFDYRQSNANRARDPFTQPAAGGLPGGLKNQFGGSLGGPIWKDRIFAFGDYQGVRQKVGISNLQTVPTANLISTCLGQTVAASGIAGCDFSEYLAATATNPVSSQLVIYQPNGTPYAGNVIPTAMLSPQALALLKLLQPYKPNANGGNIKYNGQSLNNNYSAGGTGGFNSNQWDVRGDLQLNERIHSFGRFSRFTDTLTGKTMFGAAGGAGFGLGSYGGNSAGANDSLALGTDIVVNPKLVTDIRLGYYRYNINNSKYDAGTDFATQLGIPGENLGDPVTSGAPLFNITEVGSFGGPNNSAGTGPQYGGGLNVTRCNCPLKEKEDQFQVVNNWTKTIGNHAVKFGADLRYARNLRVPSDNDRTGNNNFGTGPTSDGQGDGGIGFATFVLGEVTGYNRYVSTSTNAKEFQKRDFFYAQDTWRATSKLTVNYGLRDEIYFPEVINTKGQGAVMNLETGYLQVAGVGQVASNMNFSKAKYAFNPRIGVAYSVTPKTVIRAGYGRSFDIGVFGSLFGHVATQNLPVLANQQLNANGGNTSYAFSLANGPSAPTPIAVPSTGLLPSPGYLVNSKARPTTVRLPTIDAWNLSIQQSLTPTLSMTMAYVGNKGTHTLSAGDGNNTNPNEPGIFLPAVYSVTGNPLHYDPSASTTTVAGVTPAAAAAGIVGIAADGGTANQTYLRRYFGGKLAACSDPNYAVGVNLGVPAGSCGWTNDVSYYGDDQDTHYNALQVTMTKTFTHGVSFNANYAWQRAFNFNSGYATWSKQAGKGRDDSTREQQIVMYGLFQLPFGHGHAFLNKSNGFVNAIVGGLQVSPIINYSSGLPFTLSPGSCPGLPNSAPCYVNGNAGALQKHTTGFAGGSGANALTFYKAVALSSNGFTTPGLDQIGNAGRNNVFGPRFFNTDIALQKNFTVREKYTAQLRVDGYNAFNHINFGNPGGNVTQDGAIGGEPGGAAPRQLQFSGRIQF